MNEMKEYLKKVDKLEFVANWNDPDFPEDIESNLPEMPSGMKLRQDSDGDYNIEFYDEDIKDSQSVALNLTWYQISTYECPICHDKFISLVTKSTSDFYSHHREYCCGYHKGVYEIETLTDDDEIKDAIEEGFTINDDDKKILHKIYPLSF